MFSWSAMLGRIVELEVFRDVSRVLLIIVRDRLVLSPPGPLNGCRDRR